LLDSLLQEILILDNQLIYNAASHAASRHPGGQE